MAEGHTEDADALATYALTCVQLRSDHKQSLIVEKNKTATPTNDDKEKEKTKLKDSQASKKEEKLESRKSSFIKFFGGGKEKKEKERLQNEKLGHDNELELKMAIDKIKEMERENR